MVAGAGVLPLFQVRFEERDPRAGISFLQALSVSPVKPEIATGDVNGRVFVWHNLFDKMDQSLLDQGG